MPVKDIFSEGGKLPEGTAEPKGTEPSRLPKTIAQVQEARAAAQVEKAYYETLGIPISGGSEKKEDLATAIVSAAMKERTEIHNAMLHEKEATEKARTAAEESLHSERLERLKEIEERLQPPQPGQEIRAIVENIKATRELFAAFKEETAGKEPPRTPGIDGATAVAIKHLELDQQTAHDRILLELEDRKTEREKEKQDREDARLERTMTWERDNKRWEMEFGLRMQESRASVRSKQAMGEQATDLFGALTEAFTGGGGGGMNVGTKVTRQPAQRVERQPTAPEPEVRVPKAIKCSCGEIVEATEPGQQVLVCAQCGAEYELAEA